MTHARIPMEAMKHADTVSSNYSKHTQSRGLRKMLIERFDERLLSLFAPFAGDTATLLDVGCGEGFTLRKFRARYPHIAYSGCDINPAALGIAREQNPDAALFVSSAYSVQTETAYDAVLCCEVLEHLERPEAALAELRRLVREGGGLCYTFRA